MEQQKTNKRTLGRGRTGRPSKYHFATIELGERRRYPTADRAAALRIKSALSMYAGYTSRKFETERRDGALTVLRVQ